MKRLSIIVLILLFPAMASAQTTVYRYVDENGNVSYSTEAREGAEPVVIQESNTAQVPEPLPPINDADDNDDDEGPVYSRFEIVSPEKDEVIWNTGTRDMTVRIELEPALMQGHVVHVEAAGRNNRGSRTSFYLEDINRGTHQVTAQIFDRGGNLVQTAEGHQFHVRQHSVATPP